MSSLLRTGRLSPTSARRHWVTLLRHAVNIQYLKGFVWLLVIRSLFILSACTEVSNSAADKLNDQSYAFHYRSLDSTSYYAHCALDASDHYPSGRAEAYNNLAFVAISKMDYRCADSLLQIVLDDTDNQIELMIANVQMMRLCQRRSRNKEFYDYRHRAENCLKRINEDIGSLTPRMHGRLVYAQTEYAIVNSTYFYYIGLERQSKIALQSISQDSYLQRDTAQYLNYLYNVGAGGILEGKNREEVRQKEFEYLAKCYLIAATNNYPFFIANSLEAMAEHLLVSQYREELEGKNAAAIRYILGHDADGHDVAQKFAERSLSLFERYGDVYQIAGAHRTLASCSRARGNYEHALSHLESVVADPRISQAPDLVASVREQLSVAYAAVNDKSKSDYNRNIYLDLQEQTRQDRYLESRAEMYDTTARQQNLLLLSVVMAILLLIVLLVAFSRKSRRSSKMREEGILLQPLAEWERRFMQEKSMAEERHEEVREQLAQCHLQEERLLRDSLSNRAKVSLVNSITPLIDRIMHELRLLNNRQEESSVRNERYEYISELAANINEQNKVLTDWIQMRRGSVTTRIESFALQPLLDLVKKGRRSFVLKGLQLQVEDTDAVVKADRTLTLFMINTLADNARKFSDSGTVTISTREAEQYVEISVADEGPGMSAQLLSTLFEHKVYDGHGFGLMNCKGIIDQYRKTSHLFDVCMISAESSEGKGSRFFFRLPKGVMRILVLIMMVCQAAMASSTTTAASSYLGKAKAFADSAYFSNVSGRYERALQYADSCRMYLNKHYREVCPDGRYPILADGNEALVSPEIKWFRDSVDTDYDIILDMRNESAVAALALHQWSTYSYNNRVYTQLFKEMSADNTLAAYCTAMRQSQTNKTIAIILMALILLMILPAYYIIYYRHVLYYRFCLERVREFNDMLLSHRPLSDKIAAIDRLSPEEFPDSLRRAIKRIRETLMQSQQVLGVREADIERDADEVSKVMYECERMHVSNSVVDNSLSALKHETMYFPNRIMQMVADGDRNLQDVSELVDYYRSIYSILSRQATQQSEKVKIHITKVALDTIFGEAASGYSVMGNASILSYIYYLLCKQCAGNKPEVTVAPYNNGYVQISLLMGGSQGSAAAMMSQSNIPFMLCRQAIRDHSEATGRRGCGIWVESADQQVIVNIVLPAVVKQSASN